MILSPSPRFYNLNWRLKHEQQYNACECKLPEVLLLGDSIISGLERYQSVHDLYFNKINTVNCGIGGDRLQNVLWRAENLPLPPSLSDVVLLCGTNNISINESHDIADGIIAIGLSVKRRCRKLNIIISGLIPRDESSSINRIYISDVNSILKKRCQDEGFTFIDQDHV